MNSGIKRVKTKMNKRMGILLFLSAALFHHPASANESTKIYYTYPGGGRPFLKEITESPLPIKNVYLNSTGLVLNRLDKNEKAAVLEGLGDPDYARRESLSAVVDVTVVADSLNLVVLNAARCSHAVAGTRDEFECSGEVAEDLAQGASRVRRNSRIPKAVYEEILRGLGISEINCSESIPARCRMRVNLREKRDELLIGLKKTQVELFQEAAKKRIDIYERPRRFELTLLEDVSLVLGKGMNPEERIFIKKGSFFRSAVCSARFKHRVPDNFRKGRSFSVISARRPRIGNPNWVLVLNDPELKEIMCDYSGKDYDLDFESLKDILGDSVRIEDRTDSKDYLPGVAEDAETEAPSLNSAK